MSMQYEPRAPIDRCPYCGSSAGYYTKDYIRGRSEFNHSFDGTETDNSCMYDHLDHSVGKRAYCQQCDRYLFPMKEVEE